MRITLQTQTLPGIRNPVPDHKGIIVPTKTSKAAGRPVKRPAKAKSASVQPSLRFYYPEALRAKTVAVLTQVEKAKDSREHRSALADVVVELTNQGLDYYFLRPLKLAKVGFMVDQSANLGMLGVTTVLGSVIRSVIGGMDSAQLIAICCYIRQLMK
jgi:hypothetical protein